MSFRPRLVPDTPDALARPAAQDAPAPQDVPTLREILARYRQQGTVPGRLAADVPLAEPAPAPRLASLRSLFLDSTGEPTLGDVSRDVTRDDAWLQAPPSRRR